MEDAVEELDVDVVEGLFPGAIVVDGDTDDDDANVDDASEDDTNVDESVAVDWGTELDPLDPSSSVPFVLPEFPVRLVPALLTQ